MSEALIALMAAVFGGAGLKAVEAIINRSKTKTDVATQIREELRSEVRDLRDVLRSITSDLDKWKSRYYRLLVAYNELKYQLLKAGQADVIEEIEARMEEEDGQETTEIKQRAPDREV
jgi:hypothetical protein